MIRYRLRTLLIVLALGPPVLAYVHWKYEKYVARQQLLQIGLGLQNYHGDSYYGGQLPPGARWRYPPPNP